MNSLHQDQSAITAELWQLLSQFKGRIGIALIFLILAKLAAVSVPLVLKRIIDVFSNSGIEPATAVQLPLFLLAGYAALRFASTLFSELRDVLFVRVTLRTVATYALKTFAHLHALGSKFHAERRIGGLLPDIDRGTSGIAYLLGVGLFTLVPTLIEIGLVLAIMLNGYSSWYAGIIAATFIAYAIFTLHFTGLRAVHQRRVNRLDSGAKSQLADSLINYDTIKYFTNEAVEARRFKATMQSWIEASAGNQRALFALHVGQSAIIAISVGAIMLLAGTAVWRGEMRVGDLVLINAFALQVCLPLNTLGFVYREAKDAWVNAERLFQLLHTRSDPMTPVKPAAADTHHQVLPGELLRPGQGEVEFDQVSFYYERTRPLLSKISFRIPAGKRVAVVGTSGSGKSTLARLLLRFYEPVQGRILIDGQDIGRLHPSSVRQAIGVVPQDTALFNDTIGYNIAYGRFGASLDDVKAAARAAHVHDMIMTLPGKYDTEVGERGVKLSGGEKQRIAIARTILKNPSILIFDEATSALDSYSEHAIEQELNRLSRNRTTLIIAHRLSTIVNADDIVVLDRGRIVERGQHLQLLQRQGLYARLWRLQQRGKQEEQLQQARTHA